MNIILAISQAIFNSLGMIINKKILENKDISNDWQTFFARLYSFSVILVFIWIWVFTVKYKTDLLTSFNIMLYTVSISSLYFTYWLRREAYMNEKVSVLQPFSMMNWVFSIIIAFIFIKSEQESIITFISALIAFLILIISNIENKKLKINKYSLLILLSSFIKWVQIFASLYFLTLLSPVEFYFLESIVIIFISLFLIIYKKDFVEIKKASKKYFALLFLWNIFILFAKIIELWFLEKLGVIITSLISLIYLCFIYIFSYIILKEKAKKKDIITAFLISICIIIWMLSK